MRKPSNHDRLAAALKGAREKAGLSQRQMAALLHTNQTRVCLMETGDQYVRVIDLIEWCEVTGVDPVGLLAECLG